MTKGLLFMDIKDKVPMPDNGCCPPHYLPHKLPIGEPVRDEPCHTHIANWRRLHHNLFCQILACPNYPAMREKTAALIKAPS